MVKKINYENYFAYAYNNKIKQLKREIQEKSKIINKQLNLVPNQMFHQFLLYLTHYY